MGGAIDVEEAKRAPRPHVHGTRRSDRVRLLSLISAHPEREACICDLTEPVGLSQATVSHHMKQLVEAGLIVREQRGRWSFYRVVDEAFTLSAARCVSLDSFRSRLQRTMTG